MQQVRSESRQSPEPTSQSTHASTEVKGATVGSLQLLEAHSSPRPCETPANCHQSGSPCSPHPPPFPRWFRCLSWHGVTPITRRRSQMMDASCADMKPALDGSSLTDRPINTAHEPQHTSTKYSRLAERQGPAMAASVSLTCLTLASTSHYFSIYPTQTERREIARASLVSRPAHLFDAEGGTSGNPPSCLVALETSSPRPPSILRKPVSRHNRSGGRHPPPREFGQPFSIRATRRRSHPIPVRLIDFRDQSAVFMR